MNTIDTKKAYQKKLEAQMDEWASELNKFQAKAQKAKADARIRQMEMVENLREKKKSLGTHLEKLQSSGENAWEHMKEGSEKAWGDFRDAMKKARAEMDKPDE